MKRFLYILVTCILMSAAAAVSCHAQFKADAFSQNYGDNQSDTAAQKPMFSVKDFYRQMTHKDSVARIGTLFAGSTILIGGQQIYQQKYWKLPVIYGGIGATLGMGFHYKGQYKKSLDAYNSALALDPETPLTVDNRSKTLSTAMFAASGLIYWATLMDGVINFDKGNYPLAGRATLYSILLPGLGQAYNREYWKIPVYWGGFLFAFHSWDLYKTQFRRFRGIYLEATDPEVDYKGPIAASVAQYYRDIYRRYRDYAVLGMVAVYLLQIIDANVFAYMQDFEVNDDLSMQIRPTVFAPDMQFASNFGIGMSVGFRF